MGNLFKVLCVLLFQVNLWAFEIADFKPNVVDQGHQFSQVQIQFLNDQIQKLQSESGIMAAVYVVPTLDGVSVEEAAEKTFKKWQLGTKEADNGLLILVAVLDRKTKIEVGYGLEGDITDLKASRIIKERMIPYFKNGEYYEGVSAALNELSLIRSGLSTITEPENRFVSPEFFERIYMWLAGFWLIPFMISFFGYVAAAKKSTLSLQKMRELKQDNFVVQMFGARTRTGLFLKIFLTINPGIFITLFPVIFAEEKAVGFILNSIGIPFIVISIWMAVNFVRRLHSFDYYMLTEFRRLKQKEKNSSGKGGWYDGDGGSGSYSGSSSGSSSSSSSSSSSGGGSSGGGGASGSW